MRFPRSGALAVRIFGYIVFSFGVLSTVWYLILINWRSMLFDMGIGLGNGAITFIGLLALSVASCLAQLEKRLGELESARASPSEN
jgi:hypothetical protein